MSIWEACPMEGAEDNEPFMQNSIAWDQLLNNLGLQTSSDSSDDNDEESGPKSRASAFSESRQSQQDSRLKAHSTSAGSPECAKPDELLNTTRNDDDGYCSEDEHDSPANAESSDSAAGLCPSSDVTTTTAKMCGTTKGGAAPIIRNETAKSYFFVNGVRHCVQDEQNCVKWTGATPTPAQPATSKRAVAELPARSAAHLPPVTTNVAPVPKVSITGNGPDAPAAWVYTSKTAAQTPVPFQCPPKYESGQILPGGCAMSLSQDIKAMGASTATRGNAVYYHAGNAMPAGAPLGMPASYTPSRAPMPQANAAPFYAPRACPLAPPPPPPPPQLTRRPSEAAAALEGAGSVPGMDSLQYAATYAADGSTSLPTVPSMPLSKPTPTAWGSTKAWVFHDGRWISLIV